MSTINKEQINSPGPGMYSLECNTQLSTFLSPKYGFGTAIRKSYFLGEIGTPGPGNYNNMQKSLGRYSSKASLRGKPIRNDITLGPGPGAYNYDYIKLNKSQSTACKIGLARRSEL